MIIYITIGSIILGTILLIWGELDWGNDLLVGLGSLLIILSVIMCIIGCFHGFINYPKTEGTHQGVITAVDLEGVWFRRYEIYLKSNGYTSNSDGLSEETKYLIYDYETELAEKLKECVGKKVKLSYGHDGGYIGWKSCGTYHIKNVEIVEE